MKGYLDLESAFEVWLTVDVERLIPDPELEGG
jgi:hypothetical protein